MDGGVLGFPDFFVQEVVTIHGDFKRGIEFKLTKRFSNFFAGNMTYIRVTPAVLLIPLLTTYRRESVIKYSSHHLLPSSLAGLPAAR